jgi:Putative flagellar system-associated repeat
VFGANAFGWAYFGEESGAGPTYTITVSAAQAQTLTLTRAAAAIRAWTQTQAASLQKAASTTRAWTQTQAAAMSALIVYLVSLAFSQAVSFFWEAGDPTVLLSMEWAQASSYAVSRATAARRLFSQATSAATKRAAALPIAAAQATAMTFRRAAGRALGLLQEADVLLPLARLKGHLLTWAQAAAAAWSTSTPPRILEAEVDKNELVVIWSEELDPSSTTSSSHWGVSVNGHARTVSSATIQLDGLGRRRIVRVVFSGSPTRRADTVTFTFTG